MSPEETLRSVAVLLTADQRVTPEERAFFGTLARRMGLGPAVVDGLLEDARRRRLRLRLPGGSGERRRFLALMVQAAAVDGRIGQRERAVLERIAGALDISKDALEVKLECALSAVAAQHSGSRGPSADAPRAPSPEPVVVRVAGPAIPPSAHPSGPPAQEETTAELPAPPPPLPLPPPPPSDPATAEMPAPPPPVLVAVEPPAAAPPLPPPPSFRAGRVGRRSNVELYTSLLLLAHADGTIVRTEAELLDTYAVSLAVGQEEADSLRADVVAGRRNELVVPAEEGERKRMLDMLLSIACADGTIAAAERSILERFRSRLRLSDETFRELLARRLAAARRQILGAGFGPRALFWRYKGLGLAGRAALALGALVLLALPFLLERALEHAGNRTAGVESRPPRLTGTRPAPALGPVVARAACHVVTGCPAVAYLAPAAIADQEVPGPWGLQARLFTDADCRLGPTPLLLRLPPGRYVLAVLVDGLPGGRLEVATDARPAGRIDMEGQAAVPTFVMADASVVRLVAEGGSVTEVGKLYRLDIRPADSATQEMEVELQRR